MSPDPVSRWVGLEDPLLAGMIADLTSDYVGWYGPGAHAEMSRHPAEVFRPPGGGVLALVEGGVAVAAGAFRPRGAGGLGEHGDEPYVALDRAGSANGSVAEIKRMWTAADHRRRGLARRVLSELEMAAAEAGYTTMYLSTGWRQSGAIALYLAAGYRPLFDLEGDPAVPFERGFTKELSGPRQPRVG